MRVERLRTGLASLKAKGNPDPIEPRRSLANEEVYCHVVICDGVSYLQNTQLGVFTSLLKHTRLSEEKLQTHLGCLHRLPFPMRDYGINGKIL